MSKAARVHAEVQHWLCTRAQGALLSVRRTAPGGTSNRTIAPLAGAATPGVDASQLDGVIEYDAQSGLLHVEPGLPQDALARFCLARGLLCPVLLEFPGITCGGAFSGGGIESSSHRDGSFADTVEEVDVVTGDGRYLQRVNRTGAHAALFFGLRTAYGTVGVLTRLAIRGVHAAPPLVHLNFVVCSGAAQAMEVMSAAASSSSSSAAPPPPPAFIDAVALSPTRAVVVLGRACASPPPGVALLSLRSSRTSPWFAWHLEAVSVGAAPTACYMHLEDYLFRFDRGAFWMARHGLSVFFGTAAYSPPPAAPAPAATAYSAGPVPLLRYLYAWLATTRQLYALLHRVGDVALARTYIVQDFILPSGPAAAAFIDKATGPIGVWPLWLCPLRPLPERTEHPCNAGFGFPRGQAGGGLQYNVGVYGAPSGAAAAAAFAHDPVGVNRALEASASALGGRKMLYAQSFYTSEEFWGLFSRHSYERVRSEYGAAGVFPSIESKVLLGQRRLQSIAEAARDGRTTVFSAGNVLAMASWYATLWGELLLPRALQPWCGITHTGMEAMGLPGADPSSSTPRKVGRLAGAGDQGTF